MRQVEYQFERSIVAIVVDDKIVGTGFVIAPGKVLTCAHVVPPLEPKTTADPGEATPSKSASPEAKIEVEFYAVPADSQFASGGLRQVVTVDPDHYSPEATHDIAVLSWDGPLPAGVEPVRMCSPKFPLADRRTRTRGFPDLGQWQSQSADPKIIGVTRRKATGESCWTLDSSQVTCGFSGAPLCDIQTGNVVAMLCAVTSPDENWRNATTAIAIGVDTLKKVCGTLLPTISAEVERQQQQARERLKGEVVRTLATSEVALDRISDRLEISRGALTIRELAQVVADRLTDGQKSIAGLRPDLRDEYRSFRNAGNQSAANVVAAAYLACVATLLDPELLHLLRQELVDGKRQLTVPCSTNTVVEMLMAGVDGRVGHFRFDIPPGRPPEGKYQIPLPAECGIASDPQEVNKQLTRTLADGLGLTLSDFTESGLPSVLNALLQMHAEAGERRYLVDDLNKPKIGVGVQCQLGDQFPELVYILKTAPDRVTDDRQNQAIAPLLIGELIPKSDPPR